MCRLCFKEKSNSFGIFTTKGFMMGLASAIRMHFLDEVRPKQSNARVRYAHSLMVILKFAFSGQ